MVMAARVFLSLLGIALFALGFLVYEDEERTLQNKLEILWINVNDAHLKFATTEHRVLLRTFAFVRAFLDGIFGARLFSIQAVTASFAVSCSALLVILWIVMLAQHPVDVSALWGSLFFLLFVALLFFVSRRGWVGLLFVVIPVLAMGRFITRREGGYAFVGFELGSLAAILFDLGMVTVIRGFIMKPPQRMLVPKLLLGSLTLGVLSIGLPAGLATLLKAMLGIPRNYPGAAFAAGLLFLNISDLSFFLLVFLFVALLAAHHLIWPTLERPLYTLQRTSIFSYRKSLCVTGIAVFLAGI